MLNVALPKGRLGDKVYRLFKAAGYDCAAMEQDDREGLVRAYLDRLLPDNWEKMDVYRRQDYIRDPGDPTHPGKDVLLEGGSDVYELLDLGFGKCRMAEAAPVGFREDRQRPLRVATKYPAIARRFYAAQSREIEIIKLNGSIELAPLLGLSDVIVDIVETGTTLRQNNLEVTREILPISARFIANKAAMKFKEPAISRLLSRIQDQLNQKEERP